MEIHTDGYLKSPNPSTQGGGYTVIAVEYDEREGKQTKVLKQEEFDRPMTNNEAEILGLIAAIELARKGDTVVTDSNISLIWLFRGYASARRDLDPIISAAKKLANEKKAHIKNYQLLNDAEIVIEWRPRDENEAGKFNELFH